MNLKNKASKILGIAVENLGWDRSFEVANKNGTLTQSILQELVKELCKIQSPFIPDYVKVPTSTNELVKIYTPLKTDILVSFMMPNTQTVVNIPLPALSYTNVDAHLVQQVKRVLIENIAKERGIENISVKKIKEIDKQISF
jgi:hypothetical protein